MQADHRALVSEASSGNLRALDALFQRHLPGLLAFVRARAGAGLRAREDTLDLVQSACREVLRDLARHDYSDEAGFRHWLFLAAERKILDKARYHGRAKRGPGAEVSASTAEAELLERCYSEMPSPSGQVIAREEVTRLEQALQRLSEEHREVILFARVVGMSHPQIAQVTGKSEVAVKSLLRRALERLAVEMGEE